MDGIIIPSSQRVFDAVVYVNGQLEQSPKTDDDWFGIQMRRWPWPKRATC